MTDNRVRAAHLTAGVQPVLPFQNELNVGTPTYRQVEAAHQRRYSEAENPGRDMEGRDYRARDTRDFRVGADSWRAFGAMTKRLTRLLLPSTAVFVVSSTFAYALNLAVVDVSTNSSKLADVLVASPGATSHPLLIDTRTYALDRCLTAWSHVTVERPDIFAAGLEQFVESGCGDDGGVLASADAARRTDSAAGTAEKGETA